MNTGELIKLYRKRNGMSAEQLAETVGVSPSTIYRYENNDIANMGTDKLKAIATALHTDAHVLMGWDSPDYFCNIDGNSFLIEEKRSHPALTDWESVILSTCNDLNEESRKRLLSYAEFLYEKQRSKNEKKEE